MDLPNFEYSENSHSEIPDYQYLFDEEITFRRHAPIQRPQMSRSREGDYYYHSVRELLIRHRASAVTTEENILTAEDIYPERFRDRENDEFASLRFLISSPRDDAQELGLKARSRPEAPYPFDEQTFYKFIDILNFPKASFSYRGFGRVSKISGPENITSIYLENYSYENGWYKIYIAYDPCLISTSVFLHNLESREINIIYSKLQKPSNSILTIHPLFVVLLAYELLFERCLRDLGRLFTGQITLERDLGLGPFTGQHEYYQNPNVDNKTASIRAFSDGKALCGLEEKMEYNVTMGRKLLSYFEELDIMTPEGPNKASFKNAGSMIKTKLEYLVESLELQFPRLRRAKANNQLNRTGLESRLTSQTNTLSYQIASETRSDSSAMKAIAVLTMIFLPGTFLASFFAMPLFNWDSETQAGVVNGRFWIYWAVTIPGTLLVLASWRAWWVWREWDFAKEGRGKDEKRGGKVWWKVGTWFGDGKKKEETEEVEA
ncbi:hypothetical protein HYFRA_00012077 [Hymenoscyphus fraxineus]|uniref:Uncharacterized protein n=1 Tax=Hymenoscyphus fraxineus TaxID=746836 RepID=A0A9N9L1V7_9HELO|nr:hypothetical protein HYFRA_00012077 [Hymenoscyphus fraxineus]